MEQRITTEQTPLFTTPVATTSEQQQTPSNRIAPDHDNYDWLQPRFNNSNEHHELGNNEPDAETITGESPNTSPNMTRDDRPNRTEDNHYSLFNSQEDEGECDANLQFIATRCDSCLNCAACLCICLFS